MPPSQNPQHDTQTLPEAGAWAGFPNGWRQLHGCFAGRGFSIEHHHFQAARGVDWGRSFHPHSLEICINLEGHGTLRTGTDQCMLAPAQFTVYAVGDEPLTATRQPDERHQFFTAELSPAFLRRTLQSQSEYLLPVVRGALRDQRCHTALHPTRPFTAAQSAIVRMLPNPPVPPAARGLWYEARLLEWIAECLFDDVDELFCHRQQRLDRERIERVKTALTSDLEHAPTLAELARLVAISPFYLSRTFSRLTGETIPAYLRRARMERAAELLRAGTHNVTEAAFAVGYSSLGHFSRNFSEVLGCTPGLYVPTSR